MDFRQITKPIVDRTRREWLRQMESDPSEFVRGRYERILDWAEAWVKSDDKANLYAYAIVGGEDEGYARAILELSHARPTSEAPWLKVLSIHVEPSLDVSTSPPDIFSLAEISALAIKECLRLAFTDHKSSTLKVYAEEPVSLPFLQGISTTLGENLEVSTHNRWLVLSGLEFNNH